MNFKCSNYFTSSNEINDRKERIGYSTRSCKPLLLSDAVYKAIVNNTFSFLPQAIIKRLYELKFIVNKEEEELLEIIKENNTYFKRNKDQLYVVVQHTSKCQLGCVYCGQSHSDLCLDEITTQLIVERIFDKLESNKCKSLRVAWYGGEPLLELDKLKEITEILKRYCDNNDISYAARFSTNGILLTPSVYQMLVNECDVQQVEITLDGLKKQHDRNRHFKNGKGSFDIILKNLLGIADLYKNWNSEKTCRISVRCNVNKHNDASVSELIQLLAKLDLQKLVTFYVKGVYSWAQNDADKDSIELIEFSQKEIVWMKEMKDLGFQVEGMPIRISGACVAISPIAEMYDPFGNVYCCTEASLSEIYDNSAYNLGKLPTPSKNPIAPKWHNTILTGTIPCRECKVLPICGGGCPKSWEEGNIPCLSYKYNLEERLLLAFSKLVKTS